MTDCSPCGMAVEWVRSCKTSRWRLFENAPDVFTEGQYYFVDDDTPFYPEYHNLWSRDWVTDECPPDPPLGEQAGYAEWNPGAPPGVYPIMERVGRAGCCADGAIYPQELAQAVNVSEGFLLACLGPEPGPWFMPFGNFCQRQSLIRSVQVLEKMATASPGVPPFVEATWGVPRASLYSDVLAATMPATMIADYDSYTVVWIGGSPSFEALVWQALGSLIGPNLVTGQQSIGPWWQASLAVEARIKSVIGNDASRPLVLVGYSMGGVIATTIGDRCLTATPNRNVRVVGFGTPKCVGSVLHNKNIRRPWCYIANRGDPVVDIPPGLLQLGPLSLLIPFAVKIVWATYFKPGNQTVLEVDGQLNADNGACFYYGQLVAIIASYLLGVNPDPVAEHSLLVYGERLLAMP